MKLNEKGIAKIEFRHFLLLLLVFSFIWILGEISFSKLNIDSLYQLKPIWTKLILLLAFHCVFLRGANNFVGNCISFMMQLYSIEIQTKKYLYHAFSNCSIIKMYCQIHLTSIKSNSLSHNILVWLLLMRWSHAHVDKFLFFMTAPILKACY